MSERLRSRVVPQPAGKGNWLHDDDSSIGAGAVHWHRLLDKRGCGPMGAYMAPIVRPGQVRDYIDLFSHPGPALAREQEAAREKKRITGVAPADIRPSPFSSMSVATDSMARVVPPRPKQRGVQGLVISPDLDALLEHDDRQRRAWASPDSAGFPPVAQGLPPPPRRSRVPASPSMLSPPPPRSPLVQQPQSERASTPGSVDSNPYINPTPMFVDEPGPTPISPPPRTTSIGQGMPRRASESSSVGIGGSSSITVDRTQPQSHDRWSPSSSGTSSPCDNRFPPTPRAFLPLLKKSPPKDPIPHKRSRGKLVKQRDSAESQRSHKSQQSQSEQPQTQSQTQQSQMSPRQRSRRRSSISVSSDQGSFIDLFSPSSPEFPTDRPSVPASPSHSSSQSKPPIPTTPKPDFRRRPAPKHAQTHPRPTPLGPPSIPVRALPPDTMPPTTNFLNPTERAQLIKKSRKLAQVFGQTPGAADFLPDSPASPGGESASSFLDVGAARGGSGRSGRGHRAAASMNMVGQMPAAQRPLPPWPAPDKTVYMTVNGRRHSTPSTPVSDEGAPGLAQSASDDDDDDARSFMDFNSNSNSNSNEQAEEVGPDDSISVSDSVAPSGDGDGEARGRGRRRTGTGTGAGAGLPASPSSPSLFGDLALSPEERAEAERRRRRDKLAKLHRFLGSRVPASLVLGPALESPGLPLPLPPPVVALDGTLALDASASVSGASRPWVRRRRSSSMVGGTAAWLDARDRVKEELNEREKAIIVRRAQKMEKVFGVAPPQKLYNSSSSGSASGSSTANASNANTVSASSNAGSASASNTNANTSAVERNPNQAPYRRKSAYAQGHRSGAGDSGEFLLADAEPGHGHGGAELGVGVGAGAAGSFVYTHYQHSLNSLHDILDRDDKASLAELHQYLNDVSDDADAGVVAYWDPDAEGSTPLAGSPLEFITPTAAVGASAPATPSSKAARRRSLPARTSMASLASVLTTGTVLLPGADAAATREREFQARRRRAAKLTQFFGVDYRDLIEDVLESIEHGLDAERRRGTLNPQQAEDLLQKLRTLKTRRT